jgi:hypothetical protein
MSSKKITDADKLEIIDLYRQTGDTTASLASRYGVSNSTIGRILKMSIPTPEYELLIQQKRSAKGGDSPTVTTDLSVDPTEISPAAPSDAPIERLDPAIDSIATDIPAILPTPAAERDLVTIGASDTDSANRRVRRRSSAPVTAEDRQPLQVDRQTVIDPELPDTTLSPIEQLRLEPLLANIEEIATPVKTVIPSPIPRLPVLRDILADSNDRYFKPPTPPEATSPEADEDPDEDVNALAAMFGEEIADGEDDDDTDGEDWDEDAASSYQQLDRDRLLTEDRLHVQVTPLSQAILPRTCYIVIDKFAELIVRPLKDFADLGQIASEETQQRTLPVFDNHRVAKRFSNQRTQRVIKVPDSRIFHKTTHHLRSKGITCLLVDGNIYSLN